MHVERDKPQEDIPAFEAQAKTGVTNPRPYDRLMIFYRKEKRYADELRIVKRAIAVFQKQLDDLQRSMLKGNRKRVKILELSTSISKQMGLTDKKGKALHVPEPIARWMKRQQVIQKKMGSTSLSGGRAPRRSAVK